MGFGGQLLLSPQDITSISSTAQLPVGSRALDILGNEYVYLQGVASTVIGSWVTFTGAGLTALSVADAVGPMAVAAAACVANKFGWYMIYGVAAADVATSSADGAYLDLTSTPGRVSDTPVAGDRVKNTICRSLAAANSATVQLFYPVVENGVAV